MKEGTIVSLVTLSGEFLGKWVKEENGNITLNNPRMLVNTPDGKVGFARGVCMTGTENTKEAMFYVVELFSQQKPIQSLASAYTQAVTGLAVPAQGKVII